MAFDHSTGLSVIKRDATRVKTMVATVKQPANIYQLSSSKTSVNAGTLSYTLLTMLKVASYFLCAWVDILFRFPGSSSQQKKIENQRYTAML